MGDRLDADTLIAEVAKRHNVLLERKDPVLLVATIAELSLAEAREAVQVMLREASDQIAAASGEQMEAAKETARRIVTNSGSWVGDQVRASMAECREALLVAVCQERQAATAASRRAVWAERTAVGAAALAVGVLVGRLLVG